MTIANFKNISPWQVNSDSQLASWPTAPDSTGKYEKSLKRARSLLAAETAKLQASRSHSLLVILQATDAAGKDSAIREVFTEVNVNAIRTEAFKRPTPIELRHDFIWRCARVLPARGEVVIFNRSHYEEVTTVRVHPEYLGGQYPGNKPAELQDMDAFWQQRFAAINGFEQQLANSRTIVLKFWLNLSKDEQKRRFQRRLDKPEKRWKFNADDLSQRPYWDAYQQAYHSALLATTCEHAPWFAIPADNKDYARWQIAETVANALQTMALGWPEADFDLDETQSLLQQS